MTKDSKAATDALIKDLKHEDRYVRRSATKALGNRTDSKAAYMAAFYAFKKGETKGASK